MGTGKYPEACRYLQMAEMRTRTGFDELFNNNITMNHSISISSGTEKAKYCGSISIYNDPGWTKASSVKKIYSQCQCFLQPVRQSDVDAASGSYRRQKAPGTLSQEMM